MVLLIHVQAPTKVESSPGMLGVSRLMLLVMQLVMNLQLERTCELHRGVIEPAIPMANFHTIIEGYLVLMAVLYEMAVLIGIGHGKRGGDEPDQDTSSDRCQRG